MNFLLDAARQVGEGPLITVGDVINGVIALVAISAFVVTFIQGRQIRKDSKDNSELARQQGIRMSLESKRQYDLAILQMNREDRKKLYAPLLAWFRIRSTALEADIIGNKKMTRLRQKSLTDLNERHRSVEFKAEMDLLASPAALEATNALVQRFIGCNKLVKAYGEIRDIDDPNEIAALRSLNSERARQHKTLVKEIKTIRKEVDKLQVIMLEDIGIPFSETGGTPWEPLENTQNESVD